MLQIRREQMAALSCYVMERFEGRMLKALRERFPDETTDRSDPELLELIRSGIERASRYDVAWEHDVARYLGLVVRLGADFDVAPDIGWAGEILRADDLDGTGKMDAIEAGLSAKAEA